MSYTIKGNKLVSDTVQIDYVDTKKKSGKRATNNYLVIHYTASRNYAGDVKTLSTGAAQASAHLVIGFDGEVTQIGSLDDCLWHAGVSTWDGINGLNQHSIGIEVVCPGYLKKTSQGTFLTWTGELWKGRVIEGYHPNDVHKTGPKYWAGFTPKQIEAVIEIGATLFNHYKMKEVVGHDMISPGRKSDPGPCMPHNVYDAIMGRKGPDESTQIDPVKGPDASLFEYKVYGIPANDALNMRATPELGENTIAKISNGVSFNRISVKGEWWYVVTIDGRLGWINSRFAMRK